MSFMHHTQPPDTIHLDKVCSTRPLAGSSSVAPVLEAQTSLVGGCDSFTLTSNCPVDLQFDGHAATNHYLSNQQYSITAVTTSAGAIAERYAYQAYGQPTIFDSSGSVISTSSISDRYTYTGREWDGTLRLYHFRARWMSGLTGRFLTRDPIGYEGSRSLYPNRMSTKNGDPSGNDIYCFVFHCPEYGGVNDVDIEDVTNDDGKRNDSNCARKKRRWRFRANRNPLRPGIVQGLEPCDGYIVQKVTVSCNRSECEDDGSCGKNEKSDSFSYYEAWYVGNGSQPSGEPERYTDQAITPPGFVSNESCGSYLQTGEVNFFCSSVTGNLGKPAKGGSWSTGGEFGNGVCNTRGGTLPSTSAPPAWWNAAPVIVSDDDNKWSDRSIKSSFHSFATTWDCCCKKKKERGATATSEP